MSGHDAASRLRSVMASVPAGVAIVDTGGRVVQANARWQALADGLPGAGHGRTWRALIHPDDRALLPAVGGRAAEVRGIAATGRERWVSVTVTPMDDGDGAVVSLTDIDAAKRDEMERAALHRVADVVARGDDPGAVFARVAEEVAVLVGGDGAGVARFGDDVARLVGRWAGDPVVAAAGDELPLDGEGTTARVFATGCPSRVDYSELPFRNGAAPHPWQVSVAAPIRVRGALWGALGVVSVHAERLAADAEERLTRFADFVGIAISNSETRERLVRQASIDPLTGLAHHGAFHESLIEEVARAGRYGHALSLAVIDIDNFKLVNDVHGHLVGDHTLRGVADRLRMHARVIDVIARVGGEEFAWLMPQTTVPGARIAAERFRMAVGHAPFGEVDHLTVSLGVADLDTDRADAAELFRRADDALYRAKDAGRDRTVVSARTPPVA